MSDSRRETQRLVRDLKKCGFLVTRTGSGHWKVAAPQGPGSVIMAFSPRKTALHKTMARLKEIGYDPQG